ncbi:hypothetical protein TNCV_4618491 [Trichonephila clavipes]|nr:hypothetical protein TNCV_4618491 [Trichonephila clavipes]
MNEDRTSKKIFNAQPTGTRRRGRPNLKLIDGLEKDILVLRTWNWITLKKKKTGLDKASGEGQGPPWAVVPLRKDGHA